MKHLIKSIILLTAALAFSALPACTGGISILGKNVALVSDRNPDGTFKAVTDVRHPVTGEFADGSARLYHFPGGDVGVSVYTGGALAGRAPSLKQ